MSEGSASSGWDSLAGYLGPQGTFSEEALLGSLDTTHVTPVAIETIRDAVMGVQEGRLRWSLVPIENSVEGSVTITLDTLAGEARDVRIVGEVVLPVRHFLIAAEQLRLEEIQTIVSHPHVPGQCTRFLHGELAHARIVAASSTAEAVRLVKSEHPDWAAIGTRLAAELHHCEVLAEEIQDREDNETRFVWLAHASESHPPPLRTQPPVGRKTSVVFWGAGADHSGWLVRCLDEFARRDINLTKIESRPTRERLGHYMFFVDLVGEPDDESVGRGLKGLEEWCQEVLVLGSYPSAGE